MPAKAYEFIIKEIDNNLSEKMTSYSQLHPKGTNSIPFAIIQQIQLETRAIVKNTRNKVDLTKSILKSVN